MARTHRDAYGVPHVRAGSISDLAHGQGEVTARDRAWQLEYLRRRAAGTTAEVLGARRTRVGPVLPSHPDARHRPTGARPAPAGHDGLRGVVRRGRQRRPARAARPELERLGIAPVAWEPWTPLAVFLAQHLLFASLPGKLWTTRAREVLGEDAGLLSHEGPHAQRQQRVGCRWRPHRERAPADRRRPAPDDRVARGLSADPAVLRRVRRARVRLPRCPGRAALRARRGRCLGDHERDGRLPGRLRRAAPARSAGSRRSVPTVGRRPTRGSRRSRSPAARRSCSRWSRPAAGPVFSGSVDEGHGLSVRTASGVLGDLGFDAFLPLLHARTAADVEAAFDDWVEPVNNVVVADRDGDVRYRVAGRIPVRPDGNRRGVVPRERSRDGLDRMARPASAARRAVRRAGGHRQRAARAGERRGRHGLRPAAPGGADPCAARRPHRTERS